MSAQFYQLAYGGPRPEIRNFPITKMNDAVTKFANKVTDLDDDPAVGAAWVTVSVVSGSTKTTLLAWTKTSNESETIDGELVIGVFG